MSGWMQWLVLSALTGSPVLSLGILVVFWWSVDRFTFHLLPDPLRGLLRLKRARQLRDLLANNPNDRRARFELADILVQRRKFGEAMKILRPNIEAGDQDVPTLFLFGVASGGAKSFDQAERVLSAALEDEPSYRKGDLHLELGRVRLAKGDLAGAETSLRTFVAERRSTVEGRVLLAQVREKTGDLAEATRLRDEAWDEHVSTPRRYRARERLWAWRAKPKKPIGYALITLGILGLVVFGLPALVS